MEGDTQPVQKVIYLSTESAYDMWADHYDGDGNFLQALDTLELQTLLPNFLEKVVGSDDSKKASTDRPSKRLKIVDLGCGTGRNTLQLIALSQKFGITDIAAFDLSVPMLQAAQKKSEAALVALKESGIETSPVVQFLPLDIATTSLASNLPEQVKNANAAISTLVVEHLPLDSYFEFCTRMLPNLGARLLVTNMHAEMGKISQAGFIDPVTGAKVRPQSYAHGTAEVVAAAKRYGWELDSEILEKGVDTEDLVQTLGRRSKKWKDAGVKVWFGMSFVRSSGRASTHG